MKTTPLLLTSGNIIATRELRKTQTRRVADTGLYAVDERYHGEEVAKRERERLIQTKCPYGQVGDRIAFRETWWGWGYWHNDSEGCHGKAKWRWVDETDARHPVLYDADKPQLTPVKRDVLGYHKRPSIYLPKDAWRYIVEITDIRIESLQSISEDDAIAEGIIRQSPTADDLDWCEAAFGHREMDDVFIAPGTDCGFGPKPRKEKWGCTPRQAFQGLWDSINGKQRPGRPDISWKANPWVWAITYRLIS